MSYVYIVHHVHDLGDGAEDVKLIGVFSDRNSAEKVVENLKKVVGFSESQEGFSIDMYEVNRVHWAEGFCDN